MKEQEVNILKQKQKKSIISILVSAASAADTLESIETKKELYEGCGSIDSMAAVYYSFYTW